MEKEIIRKLTDLNCQYEFYEHSPVITATDRYPLDLTFDAIICKNLLVTTRNYSRFFLIMLPHYKTADLNMLRTAVSSGRLGFAKQEHIRVLLNQSVGSVGVCGAVYDTAHAVTVVFDVSLQGQSRVAMHPGINSETIVMSFENIYKYVKSCGNSVMFLDFPMTEGA